MNNTAFDTNVEAHAGLLNKFASKGVKRMCALGIPMDFEDVRQEMQISGLLAARTYNPEKGVSFTAYMGRSVWNNFNKSVEKLVDEKTTLGMVSLDAMLEEAGFEKEYIEDSEPSLEERMEHIEEMRDRIALLSVKARLVVRDLISPSQALSDHHAAMWSHRQYAKEIFEKDGGGHIPNCPKEINLRFIAKFHGITYIDFVREIKSKLGIDIR